MWPKAATLSQASATELAHFGAASGCRRARPRPAVSAQRFLFSGAAPAPPPARAGLRTDGLIPPPSQAWQRHAPPWRSWQPPRPSPRAEPPWPPVQLRPAEYAIWAPRRRMPPAEPSPGPPCPNIAGPRLRTRRHGGAGRRLRPGAGPPPATNTALPSAPCATPGAGRGRAGSARGIDHQRRRAGSVMN